MLFHSKEFLLFFLPIVWVGFLLLVKCSRFRGALAWVTLASFVFYAWWNPSYIWLILASIGINYSIGRLVRPSTGRSERARRRILVLGLLVNLGALAYYKYANFFVDNLNGIFRTSLIFEKVFLPLAISFFTFQQIVFLVESYRGAIRNCTLLEYSFSVTFFPHLIAGPIVQYHELLPQIQAERWKPITWINLQAGLTLFIIGLFKKMVLGDGSGVYANAVFPAVGSGSVLYFDDAWVGALGYTLQIYFDFSGYSDMAIGLARCFGIHLPLNFAAPYRATSIIEFWRRWHITLSRFLRDYVYIPLGGGRQGHFIRYRNLLATMLLGGLWHGAGWTFVVWGGLHGLYLVVNHSFHALLGVLAPSLDRVVGKLKILPVLATIAAWALTMLAVIVAWVFFRAESFGAAVSMLQSMFFLNPGMPAPIPVGSASSLLGSQKYLWLALAAGIALIAPTSQFYLRLFSPSAEDTVTGGKVSRSFPAWRPSIAHGLVIGALGYFVVRAYFVKIPTEFLYFNF